jgi:hypothetical protein
MSEIEIRMDSKKIVYPLDSTLNSIRFNTIEIMSEIEIRMDSKKIVYPLDST